MTTSSHIGRFRLNRSWYWLSPFLLIALFLILRQIYPYLGLPTAIFLSSVLMWISLASAWSAFSAHTDYWNLGVVVFWGLGAYTAGFAGQAAALFGLNSSNAALSLFQALPPAIFAGALMGLLIGALTLHLSRTAFALMTLVLAWIAHTLLTGIGWQIPISPVQPGEIYTALLVFATLGLLLNMWLYRSQWGATLMLIREDERLAASQGVNINAVKIAMLSISGGLTAAIGCIMAYDSSYISPDTALPFALVPVTLACAILGGYRHPWGPVIGALVLVSTSTVLPNVSMLLVITTLVLFICVRFMPQGILGYLDPIGRWSLAISVSKSATTLPTNEMHTALPYPVSGDVDNASYQPDAPPVLIVRDMNYNVEALQVLTSVNIHVLRGQAIGLVGPHDSGKSAILDCISGFTRAQSADIFLLSEDITHLPPWLINRYGLVRTFTPVRLFKSLTVLENLVVVRNWRGLSTWAWFTSFPDEIVNDAMQILRLIRLHELADVPARQLSFEHQRLLMLGMVLMSRPHIVLLDEPSAGMSDASCDELARLVRRLRIEYGLAFLITDSNLRFVSRVCDQILVLRSGRIVAEGTASEIAEQAS